MRIGIVQIDCVPGDVASNTDRIIEQIRLAHHHACAVVVFPEMVDTGYDLPVAVTAASQWPEGSFSKIAAVAQELEIQVIAGLAERTTADQVCNTAAVIGRDGQLIARYRKVHLITAEPICEQNYMTAGQDLCLFELDGVCCGLMTCYDIRFPEMARALAASGAEIIFAPAAFPLARISHWRVITECRAIENQVFVVACNRVGTDAGVEFGGSSRVITPTGELLSAMSESDEGLTVCDIQHDSITAARSQLKIWQDRQPDLYRRWLEQAAASSSTSNR